MTFRRAVLVAWILIALVLLARSAWERWRRLGPLEWGKPWNGLHQEAGSATDPRGLDDGDELERNSRWEPLDRKWS